MHLYINHLIGGLCRLNNEFLGTGSEGKTPKPSHQGKNRKGAGKDALKYLMKNWPVGHKWWQHVFIEEKLANETKYK